MLNIPPDNNQVMPYLILNGADRFLDFVTSVFDAREVTRHLNDDQTIMHAQVMIGECAIMLGECKAPWEPMPAGLFVYVENADESFDKAVKAGATVVMGLTDQPYGRTCGVKDPTGNTWWITTAPAVS